MRISDTYTLNVPAGCFLQIDGERYFLGTYDKEADAARVFDRVARCFGRSRNFPDDYPLEVVGRRSEGSVKAVTDAMEAGKTFMASGGSKGLTSRYIGVSKTKDSKAHPWWAYIQVPQGDSDIEHTPTHTHTQAHTHTRTASGFSSDWWKAMQPWFIQHRGRRSHGTGHSRQCSRSRFEFETS